MRDATLARTAQRQRLPMFRSRQSRAATGSEYGKLTDILSGEDKKQTYGYVSVYFESQIDSVSQMFNVLTETMKLKNIYGLTNEK